MEPKERIWKRIITVEKAALKTVKSGKDRKSYFVWSGLIYPQKGKDLLLHWQQDKLAELTDLFHLQHV